MKPVTELYEAALQLWPRVAVTSSQEAERLRSVAERLDGPALEVLDLVATLPPERLEEVRRCVEGEGEKRWRAALGPWNDDGVSVETCIGLMRRTLDAYKGLPQITSPQLGLVRWVVGLSEEETAALGEALSDYQKCVEGGGDSESQAIVRRLMDRWDFALSGGEGDKKCGECAGTGKVKRLEGGGSIRVVKYDPCQQCAEGDGGAKEEAPRKKTSTAVVAELLKRGDMETAEARGEALGWRARANRLGEENERLRSALGDIRVYLAGSNPQRDLLALGVVIKAFDSGGTKEAHPACTSSGCKSCGFSGGCDQEEEEQRPHPMWGAVASAVVKPGPTILPAGKPPPFLRVGMKLRRPDAAVVWVVLELTEDFAHLGCGKCIMWMERRTLLTWPLAEDFTVEGKS